jgi:FkbH-like protein
LCSKNNPEDVWPVVEGHPHMVLRRSRFVAARLNWRDKASNIVEIARELNIGVDSLVFLDDNPAERALVRQQIPQVLTVELPADPAYFVRTLQELDVFESLGLTDEDRQRGDMYRQARDRREYQEVRATSSDLTSHLESLQIAVTIRRATPFSIARVAQLVNKTNQFNLTTRRYTEPQIRAMAEATDHWVVISVSVTDRFGDLGLTGVAFVQIRSQIWVVDSFLLSCRVLGRGVENALLAHILGRARAAGAHLLQGLFIPTARNAPARHLYSEGGFQPVRTGQGADGETVFELSLDSREARREYPSWLRVIEVNDD